MYAKLTLNIEQTVIEHAKIYAKKSRRSISKLVEEYLAAVTMQNFRLPSVAERRNLGPITTELTGVIKTNNTVDYTQLLTDALMKKYL
jgi:hypothetical protein